MVKDIKDINLWLEYIKEVSPLDRSTLSETIIPSKKISINPRPALGNTLDLHGFTLNEAFDKLELFLQEHYYNRNRNVKIITGASGDIKQYFPHWLDNPRLRRYVSSYNNINSGSFAVKVRKIRSH